MRKIYVVSAALLLAGLAFVAAALFSDCAQCAVYGYEQCKCCPAECCGPKLDRCCCLHVDQCTCKDPTLR